MHTMSASGGVMGTSPSTRSRTCGGGIGCGAVGRESRVGTSRRRPARRRPGRLQSGCGRRGRCLLPDVWQRWLRRRPLRLRHQLRPSDRCAHGRGHHQGTGDAEPVQLQPRPGRFDRAPRQGRQPISDVGPERPGARDHPPASAEIGDALRGGGGIRRCAGRVRDTGLRHPGRLHDDARRGDRRRPAGGCHGVVPGERPPDRQGVVLVRGHRSQRLRGRRQRRPAASTSSAGRPPPGDGSARTDGVIPCHHRRRALGRRSGAYRKRSARLRRSRSRDHRRATRRDRFILGEAGRDPRCAQ